MKENVTAHLRKSFRTTVEYHSSFDGGDQCDWEKGDAYKACAGHTWDEVSTEDIDPLFMCPGFRYLPDDAFVFFLPSVLRDILEVNETLETVVLFVERLNEMSQRGTFKFDRPWPEGLSTEQRLLVRNVLRDWADDVDESLHGRVFPRVLRKLIDGLSDSTEV